MRDYKPHDTKALFKDAMLVLTSSFPKDACDITTRFIYEHADIFLKNNFRTTVLCPAYKGLKNRETWNNIKVIRFNYFFPKKFQALAYGSGILENIRRNPLLAMLIPFFLFSFLYNANKLTKSHEAICSHWLLPSGLIGAIISRLYGKRHILIIHSAGVHLLKRLPLRRRIAEFILNNSDATVAVSSFIKRELIDILPDNKHSLLQKSIRVLPMGIDCRYYKRKPDSARIKEDAHKILYLGRLVEVKGVEYLIRAAAGIENAKLLIAGHGPLMEKLRILASELKVDADFLGKVSTDEKLKLMSKADCLVLPSIRLGSSRTESMPLTIMEALSVGLPVIATRVGGIPEIIKDGYNGILVPEKDPSAIRDAIEKIISSSCLKKSLEEKALETSRNYDWQTIRNEYEKILTAV